MFNIFVADRVKKGKVSIQHCPTNKILVDFFTKPLQGSLFKFSKDIITGYIPIQQLFCKTSEIKELVVFSDKNTVICAGSTKGTLVSTQKEPSKMEMSVGTKPVLSTLAKSLGRTQRAGTEGMVSKSRHSQRKNKAYNTVSSMYASVVKGLV